MCADPAKGAALYRFYNGMKELLYIGISADAFRRAVQHRRTAQWSDEAVSMHVVKYPSREAAAEAERLAIAVERPKYNRHHSIPMLLPDPPIGMEIADEGSDLPHVSAIFEDAENDTFRLDFEIPRTVTFRVDELSYIQLTAENLRDIADMIEAADRWSDEMLASENGVARRILYDT